jgi:hypothetical protein
MTKEILKNIIKEELSNILKEEYLTQYKVKGTLITDTTKRPQQDILSNIRALTGVTVVSTVDVSPDEYSQNNENLRVILNLKIDGYPFIRHGGFSKDTIMKKIVPAIKRIDGVKGYIVNPADITSM